MAVKVSIVTVVYNGAAWLPATFDSIFSQTFTSYEYLVIDGNSTDGTLELIHSNASRITRWISEPDKGLYDAMNKGLAMAKGEYILFMNAGDTFFSSTVLEKIFMQAPADADILYGETMMIDEQGKELGTRSQCTPHRLPAQMRWTDFRFGMVVCHQSILIRSSLAPAFDIAHPYCADIDWIIASLKKSTRVYQAPVIISRYLKGGLSDKRLKQSLRDRFSVLSSHFGWLPTVLAHMWISIRAVWFYKIKPLFS
ncbi:MAG: glycosyltransferase [Cytophagaceae bacterium]|jgi:glycosyltransferase involved in cell wall biosynthesis|nr:glycosyltransferase [Cytophagaceae bacterium]